MTMGDREQIAIINGLRIGSIEEADKWILQQIWENWGPERTNSQIELNKARSDKRMRLENTCIHRLLSLFLQFTLSAWHSPINRPRHLKKLNERRHEKYEIIFA